MGCRQTLCDATQESCGMDRKPADGWPPAFVPYRTSGL